MNVDALIFAGGVGRRMGGSSRPKQFLELGGRPIIDYTIEKFATHPQVSGVVVVCLESWIDYLNTILSRHRYPVPIDVIPGGSTGQESISFGLRHLHEKHGVHEDSIVLVHDGVRPLISQDAITACIRSVEERGCTAIVAPATETIVVEGESEAVESILPRERCGLARAPQGFVLEDLYSAHIESQQRGLPDFIDSISMMSYFGRTIYMVEGPAENIKVTTPIDYYAFKGYMEARDQLAVWRDEQ